MRFMKGKQGRIAVERLFLLLYIPLVLAMMLVMPVGGPPDEQAHLKQVWLLSTGQVGNDGHIFLAMNPLSKGRLIGSGVYIGRLEIRLIVNGKRITKRTQDFLMGFRHPNLSISDFDLNK